MRVHPYTIDIALPARLELALVLRQSTVLPIHHERWGRRVAETIYAQKTVDIKRFWG
jgi:hypothetical protein